MVSIVVCFMNRFRARRTLVISSEYGYENLGAIVFVCTVNIFILNKNSNS